MKEVLKKKMLAMKSHGHDAGGDHPVANDDANMDDTNGKMLPDEMQDKYDSAPSLDSHKDLPDDPMVLPGEKPHSLKDHGDPSHLTANDMQHGMDPADKAHMLEKIASSRHPGRGPMNIHEMASTKMKNDIANLRKK